MKIVSPIVSLTFHRLKATSGRANWTEVALYNFFPRARTRARATSYSQFRSYSNQIPRALRVNMYFFLPFFAFLSFFFTVVTLVSKFQCFIDLERSCSHGYTAMREEQKEAKA